MGLGGMGQVEVRFSWMSPWRDKRTTNQPTRKDRATQPMDYGRLRWAKSASFLKKLSWPEFKTYSSWTRKLFLNCPHQHFSAIFLEQYVSLFQLLLPSLLISPGEEGLQWLQWLKFATPAHQFICSSPHLLRWRRAAVQSFAVSPLATQSQRFTGPERW